MNYVVNNEYSKLKSVIVGNELNPCYYLYENHTDTFELEKFFHFFKRKFDLQSYNKYLREKQAERKEDLLNLKNVLQQHNIRVVHLGSSGQNVNNCLGSNVRDLIFSFRNYLIITNSPLNLRNQEYKAYLDIIPRKILHERKIITLPIQKGRFDFDHHHFTNDFSYFEKHYHKYSPVFEAANLLKLDKDTLIMNVSNLNEYSGYKQLQTVLDDIEIIPVFIDYGHIDGALNVLNNKTALICCDSSYISKDDFIKLLPVRIQKMDLIYVDKYPPTYRKNAKYQFVASIGGMFVNNLSISDTTVVLNKDSIHVKDELRKRGFTIIDISFRHSSAFGGGLHCTTLDLEREESAY